MNSFYAKGGSAVQIAEHISAQIKAGELKPGEVLDPVRKMAQALGVNPNTVASAYGKLRNAGLVATRGRAGTVVLQPLAPVARSPLPVPPGMRDLASGKLDAALLPRLAFTAADIFPQHSGYDVSEDLPALCTLGSEWLAGQGVAADGLAVFSGALDAIEKALRCHAVPGSAIWVEDPCWPPLLTLLRHLRLKALPLPLDEQGCCLPESHSERGCAVILTPRAQNPTGLALSAERAQRWRVFLRQNPDCLAIADDFWGPLSSQPLHLPFDGTHGLYVLSVSKFLGPDLRIALACGKPAVLQAMRADQSIRERWVSHILQQATATLWAGAGEVLAQARQVYRQRRQLLVEKLQQLAGISLPPGEGLYLWLPVSSETAACQLMAQRGWLVQSGEPFRLKSGPALRISLANVAEEQLTTLAQDLCAAMQANVQVN
ncbi:GntR family transcriptional regulator [Gibbsiella quercinecans]|uniref:Transcriptional regulator n=1 Tax=Gibbsiella quercinecans TaxID=929813 RepID=A0A250B7E7_9GAMM|nr:aminotransferase class I/II-fold pyridoxal phosphate-dependent enzyme [Gibbsiella quercinecans]ATA22150.1 transcriptional regulator [Gibbsiella quercinecans]RLM09282.1 transcriptional regulator [Gibbsiella quercinecans]RLM09421.1 transcriptional regulator [Gibbsiella quercinecans]TCT88051.1 GntR family transcriptional regulator [Gibbsiella quercinecans]